MAKELAKQYSPQDVENRIYQFWLDGHYFHAKLDPEEDAVHHRDPAAQHYGAASHGPCAR